MLGFGSGTRLFAYIFLAVFSSQFVFSKASATNAVNFSEEVLDVSYTVGGNSTTLLNLKDHFTYYRAADQSSPMFVLTNFLFKTSVLICFEEGKSVCSKTYNSVEAVRRAFSHWYGFKKLEKDEIIHLGVMSELDEQKITSTTRIQSVNQNQLNLEVEAEYRDVQSNALLKRVSFPVTINRASGFAGMKFEFSDKVVTSGGIKTLSEIRTDRFKVFAEASVRLVIPYKKTDSQTGRVKNMIRRGSGFFYTSRNLIMTNYHVIEKQKDCVEGKRSCEIRFLHTDRLGQTRTFTRTVNVLALDFSTDFALLEVNTPNSIPARVLEVERSYIDSNLVAVGYPNQDYTLKFSFGYLNSFHPSTKRIVSSIQVRTGFSGSPVIDLKSGKIVGIVKEYLIPGTRNRSGYNQGPNHFVLLHGVERDFGLEQYPAVQLAYSR